MGKFIDEWVHLYQLRYTAGQEVCLQSSIISPDSHEEYWVSPVKIIPILPGITRRITYYSTTWTGQEWWWPLHSISWINTEKPQLEIRSTLHRAEFRITMLSSYLALHFCVCWLQGNELRRMNAHGARFAAYERSHSINIYKNGWARNSCQWSVLKGRLPRLS